MRSFTLIALAAAASLTLSSCGILAHQANRTMNLLSAPFRAELEQRFFDGIPELERKILIPLSA